MIKEPRKNFSLFGDNWIYKIVIERFPHHPLLKLKPLVDKVLKGIEKDVASSYYNEGLGRPAFPVGVILKMLLLEYLYGLSDRQVCFQVNCNILFKWFCGLDIDERVPDDTTLVKFRKRLGEEGFKEIFEAFIFEAKKLGYGKGKLKILDATHVFSSSRGFGFSSLLRNGIKRLAKRLKERGIFLQEEVRKVLVAKGKVKIREVKRVIKEIKEGLGDKVDKGVRELANLLEEIASGVSRKIGSLVDLDARWGYKSKDFPFFGYKLHPCCDETGFITNLEVLPGNTNEGNRLKGVIEEEKKKGRIEGVVGDALYDTKENREYLKKVGIKGYIPSRTKESEIDKFVVEGERVRCSAGKYSIGRVVQEGGFLYYFSVRDCRSCRYYGRCVSPGEVRKRVYLSDCKRLRENEYKEKMRIRRIIERIFGWLKRWLGMIRARYRGIGKVSIQSILAIIALDLKIMIRGPC